MLQSRQNGKAFSGAQIAENPEVAAVLSKLLRPKETDRTGLSDSVNVVYPNVDQISKLIMTRVEDSENTFKLFPDIELAAQIIISSILSPKDMVKTKLNFRFDSVRYPATMTAKILEILREEMVINYKLEDELYEILRDALFRGGSHPKIVLPEAAVDQLINSSETLAIESIHETGLFSDIKAEHMESIGLLGTPMEGEEKRVLSLESMLGYTPKPQYNEHLFVSSKHGITDPDEVGNIQELINLAKAHTRVTDNYQVFKLPELIENQRTKKIAELTRNRLHVAMESSGREKVSPQRLYNMLYKSSPSDYVPYTQIPSAHTLKRRSIGRPLVINPPCESIIPVYVPGDYSKHIGYFIAVGADGNPVSLDSVVTEFAQSLSATGTNGQNTASASTVLTDRAKKNILSDNYTPVIDRLSEIYSEIYEKDLMERLSRGIYGHMEVGLGRNTELSRIMLARAWKGKYTRLVYVPVEYTTYFAFNYHRNGVGRSYLDDLSTVIGMRAMVLFSSIWARVRSSISGVKAHVTLDPRDRDPVKTIETVKHLVARSRQQYFPMGARSSQDYSDWLWKAGVMMTWSEHPGLPNTQVEMEARNIEHVQPDDSLEETLRHMTYMHFGLSPETVDSAAQADFATTVQNQSILFARRILMLGKKFSQHLTDYTRKVAFNDEIIQTRLVDVLNQHQADVLKDLTDKEKGFYDENKVAFTKYLLSDILNHLEVGVPEPDTTVSVNQKTELDSYEELLDKAITFIFSSETMGATLAGETSQYIDEISKAWKAELMRRFMADNNIAPEAFEVATMNEDGEPMVNLNNLVETHNKNVMAAVIDLIQRMKKAKEASIKDLAQVMGTDEQGNNLDSGYGSGGDASGDDGTGDDTSMDGFDEFSEEENSGEPSADEPAAEDAEAEEPPADEPPAQGEDETK